MNSPKWYQYIGDRQIYTLEQAEQYLENRMLTQWERLKYGNYIVFVKPQSEEAEDLLPQPVGCVGLFTREGLEGADLGYAFVPEGEGHGYATEASQRLVDEAFQTFQLPFLNGFTTDENIPSQKILERLGFTWEGHIQLPNDNKVCRKYILYPPTPTPTTN
eukprot:scaffold281_cov282-Ochromonas_danica.AAC.10